MMLSVPMFTTDGITFETAFTSGVTRADSCEKHKCTAKKNKLMIDNFVNLICVDRLSCRIKIAKKVDFRDCFVPSF